jgi:hypothetical protein
LKYLSALHLLLLILCATTFALAQSTDATISGVVVDPVGKVIPDAAIEIVNDATGVHYSSATNGAGIYTVTILPPGEYRVQVSKVGFKTLIKPGIILNLQSAVALNFTLPLGAASETVTVDAGATQINTADGSVSTVIDRKFVENMPLNGRSFQNLILLDPGTVTASPQRSSGMNSGEFSVNGQRTESNYFTVDGVSAMGGISPVPTASGTSGSLSASTALGTTQALVSVDALQEFRVEGSTYSAEYGRNPGGQFALLTRSGTNDWHSAVFNYFRNDVLDANDWFNDNTVPPTTKPPERQNDFGGTLGGPIRIPYRYNGMNRSFFFFSYEGLRLAQPAAATINAVPDIALRQSVTGPMQQVLNAFPLPTPNTQDLGGGLGEFIGSWSDPSQVDATSIRLDQSVGQRVHLFFRFSNTPSNTATRGTPTSDISPSTITSSALLSRSFTFGATTHIASSVDDDFRLNFSSNHVQNSSANDSFGGASPLDLNRLTGLSGGAQTEVDLYFGAYNTGLFAATSQATQRQWNLVDALSVEHGKHAIKMGVDWRRLAPILLQANPLVDYEFDSAGSVEANSIDYGYGFSYTPNYPVYTNFSAFIQDAWKPTPHLNVSMGIRWDVNPAPGVSQGLMPYTITGLNDYSTMTLAPQGTPLWDTSWFNLAPRLGAAYVLNATSERETVLRGGGGVFFDTGQQTGSYGFNGPGFSAMNLFGTGYGVPASFPVPVAVASPAITQPPTTPYGVVYVNPPHFQLPYTIQWNASLEQALGRSQSFTISYVGANGRKLLELASINVSQFNPQFTTLYLFKNGLTSNYNALQVKFQRQVARGLQALASYTWSHSLDYGSYNAVYPYQYGNSDFDVRNNATAAISYELPQPRSSSSLRRVLEDGWGMDGQFVARTGFPVFLNGNTTVDPATRQTYYGGLNLVPNVPLFIYGSRSTYPGGRRINPAAFSLPPRGQSGDAPRNFIRGFGAVQTDVAIRRSFPIHDSLRAQFRAEAFNVFNHPNFGSINTNYGNFQFGEATQILAESLGTLSPLYQQGGPRSLQLALKLMF